MANKPVKSPKKKTAKKAATPKKVAAPKKAAAAKKGSASPKIKLDNSLIDPLRQAAKISAARRLAK